MLGNKTRVLIDEFDFSGSFFAAETEHTAAELDNTTFGADAMTFEPGLASDKLMLRGYYSGNAAGAVFKELRARLGAAGVGTPMAVLIDTTDANCIAECSADAWGKLLKVNLATPELITFELNTADADQGAAGRRVFAGTVNATGPAGSFDFGAAGAAGSLAFLFLTAIGGTAMNATINVRSASLPNFSDSINIGAFTVSAIGGYSIPLIAASGRYIQIFVTGMGGATALTFTAVVCAKGVTY